MPVRIQRRRTKGYRLPKNAIYVGRPTRWGNPWHVGAVKHYGPAFSGRDVHVRDAGHACRLYRAWLFNLRAAEELIAPLRGHDLACWCKIGDPCHADILLELANRP